MQYAKVRDTKFTEKENKSLVILENTKPSSYSHRLSPNPSAQVRGTRPKIGHRCSLSHDMQHDAHLESFLFLSFPVVQIPSTWLGVRLLLLLRGNRPRLLQLAHDSHPVLGVGGDQESCFPGERGFVCVGFVNGARLGVAVALTVAVLFVCRTS